MVDLWIDCYTYNVSGHAEGLRIHNLIYCKKKLNFILIYDFLGTLVLLLITCFNFIS